MIRTLSKQVTFFTDINRLMQVCNLTPQLLSSEFKADALFVDGADLGDYSFYRRFLLSRFPRKTKLTIPLKFVLIVW
jgi:hypothetical protein